MITHSPGPWCVTPAASDGDCLAVRHGGEKGPVVCEVWPMGDDFEGDDNQRQRRRNAVLIAAAPDLLAALMRLNAKVTQVNNIQHSGGRLTPEDWNELYSLQASAQCAIAQTERA